MKSTATRPCSDTAAQRRRPGLALFLGVLSDVATTRRTLGRTLVATAILAAAALGAMPGSAAASTDDFRCDATAPRKYCAALPPGYADSDRRYPVVYLLDVMNEAATPPCTTEECARLAPFLQRARAQGVILVLPFGAGGVNGHVNWRRDPDGSRQYETVLIERLLPTIDTTYRTIPDRGHRTIAGVSSGGYGATALAARHPDVFSAVAAFSGPLDPLDPGVMPVQVLSGAQSGTLFSVWGDPVADEVWWRGASPLELAPNLATLSVFHSSGTGIACSTDEANPARTSPVLINTERSVHDTNEAFDRRLDELQIEHVYRERCGTHNGWVFGHWAADFAAWLDGLALGRSEPASFDHRRVDAAFSVFDWSVSADPGRAPEFLELTDVSRSGLSVTGSGSTGFVTPRLFAPKQRVCLRGASEGGDVRAGRDGRLAFTVDLGPPNSVQQFTPERRARDAIGQTHRSADIAFRRGPCR